MATAALGALRRSLPNAHLAVAVSSWAEPAIAGNADVDAIIDIGRVGSGHYRLSEYRAALGRLREGHYDAALVFDRSPLITLLPSLAGIPYRVGLDSGGRGFSLLNRVPCNPIQHEADLYLDVVRAAGQSAVDTHLHFMPSRDDQRSAQAVLAPFASTCRRPLIAVHPAGGVNPGMSMPAKRWPIAHFAALVDRLQRDLSASVVLVGGPSDRGLVAELNTLVSVPAIDIAGALLWGQLAALLSECDLLVANDTGAAHLAVAVGTPAVVIFGPTDAAQYGPYGGLGEAVVHSVPCRPCFRNGRFPRCQFEHRCMNELDVEMVLAAVLRQLGNGRRGSIHTHSQRVGA
jgi:lipopolysaccharide heptosyltransferase II